MLLAVRVSAVFFRTVRSPSVDVSLFDFVRCYACVEFARNENPMVFSNSSDGDGFRDSDELVSPRDEVSSVLDMCCLGSEHWCKHIDPKRVQNKSEWGHTTLTAKVISWRRKRCPVPISLKGNEFIAFPR